MRVISVERRRLPFHRSVVLTCLCVILTGVGSCRRPTEAPESWNIILITVDTVRADHLGCYGYFRSTSPNIDVFASKCLLFERCLAPMATTLPSHTSMLTGVYPLEHGILANIRHGGLRFEPSPALYSFAEVVRQEGYQTAAFVSAAPLKRETGIDRGFETFDQPDGRERRAAATNKMVFKWLQEPSEKPFFLWVHYFDPHCPYTAPAPFDAMYGANQQLEAYLSQRRFPDQGRRPLGAPVATRKAVDLYDGEIRYLDQQIGRLLEALRLQEDWDRTIVILVGDHGEGLCQHGEAGHGYIHDEQLHVPLMIRIPGVLPRRVPVPISIVDIFPTVLGLIDRPFWGSFLEQASGHNVLDEAFAAQPLFSQNEIRDRPDHPFPTYALTTARWKYVHEIGGTDRLFDLDLDPFELRDVLSDHLETAAELRRQLLERIAEQNRTGAAYQAGRSKKPKPLDPRLLEQLEALGYVELPEEEESTETPATAPGEEKAEER